MRAPYPEPPTDRKSGTAALLQIFDLLLDAYGPIHKWYGESRDEIVIGAVLVQNTNWLNVEKSLAQLRQAGLLSLPAIADLDPEDLALLIRPSGFQRQKAPRLIGIANALTKENLPSDPHCRRAFYLTLKGIGPETADCILLYADHLPFFVIDAYTIRIFSRQGLCPADVSYNDLQKWFMDRLPPDAPLYQEYHSLLVRLAKTACKKQARCALCPLAAICPSVMTGFA